MSESDAEFAPCRLVEDNHGGFSLLLLNLDVSSQFERHGRLGNGYGWQSAIEYLVDKNLPQIAGKLSYDSEADMFVAVSPDRNVLEQLATLIRQAIDHPTMLGEAISSAAPDLTAYAPHIPQL